MKVAITGSNGFVGQALSQHLLKSGHQVTALSRHSCTTKSHFTKVDYSNDAELETTLQDHQAIIHLIGKTHSQDSVNALHDYRKTNVGLSKSIAIAAAKAGIKVFIYLSSVKAMGENRNQPYAADTPPAPTTAYGISKLEAETELLTICQKHGMKLIIIRPPLVYSPDAKGNIHQLRAALSKRIPLPLKSIRNKRSIITLLDLCTIINMGLTLKQKDTILLPASPPALSTPQLIERIAQDLSLKPRLLPFPARLIRLGLQVIGKKEAYNKLCGNLEVIPNVTTQDQLA